MRKTLLTILATGALISNTSCTGPSVDSQYSKEIRRIESMGDQIISMCEGKDGNVSYKKANEILKELKINYHLNDNQYMRLDTFVDYQAQRSGFNVMVADKNQPNIFVVCGRISSEDMTKYLAKH